MLVVGKTLGPNAHMFQSDEENEILRNSDQSIKPRNYCQLTAKSITSPTIDAISSHLIKHTPGVQSSNSNRMESGNGINLRVK